MIVPWQVDVPQDRLPFANWLFIGIIVAVFAWQVPQIQEYNKNIENKIRTISTQEEMKELKKIRPSFDDYLLHGWTGKGIFTHMWLHADILHITGNLLFLWIFGNAVCAKIGNIIYVLIYIIAGLAAGIAHLIFSGQPMLGASGAINGIVGMYLVLFPTNSITCYWTMSILYWKQFEAPSYAIILLWLVYDIFGAVIGGDNTAYFAHFGGFATGFVIAVILLKTKFITMTRYEKSLLQVFSETSSKPQPKESYFNRTLQMDNSAHHEKTAADNNLSDIPAELKPAMPVLSTEDFLKQPESQTASVPVSQSGMQTNDGFIRFYCDCGKRCKIPVAHAGKTGKCPQCKQLIKIPKI